MSSTDMIISNNAVNQLNTIITKLNKITTFFIKANLNVNIVTNNITNVSSKVKIVSKNINEVKSKTEDVTREVQKAGNESFKWADKFSSGINKAKNKAVEFTKSLGKSAVKTGFTEAFDIEEYRLQIENATKDTKKASKVMKNVMSIANSSTFSGGDLANAAASLEKSGIDSASYLSSIGNMAASTNTGMDKATEAFINAQSGQLDSLEEFGIKKVDIQKKCDEMFANQQVISADGSINNYENYTKALNALMQENFAGGMEKQANTVKGLWSLMTGNAKSALAQIVGITADGSIKQGSALDILKLNLQKISEKFVQMQQDGTLQKWCDKFADIFGKVCEVISNVADFIIAHKEIFLTLSGIAIGFTGISKTVSGVSKVLQIGSGNIKMFSGVLKGISGGVSTLGKTLLAGGPFSIALVVIAALAAAFYLLWTKSESFRNSIAILGQNIGTWFSEKVMPLLTQLGTSLNNLWNTVILPFAQWLFTILQPLFQKIFPILMQYVSDFFSGIGQYITGAILAFNGVIDFITGIFTGNWKLAWQGVQEIFGGIFSRLVGLVKAPLNALIGLINQAIEGINEKIGGFQLPDILGGGTIGITIPTIPTLYKGTSYFGGGVALVGERGPELVTMPNGSKVNTAYQTKQLLNGNNGINVNVNIQGNVIGNESYANYLGEHILSKVQLALVNM